MSSNGTHKSNGVRSAAREKGIAIGAFNVHNLETIQAVIEGAAEERAPVIVQTTPGTLKHVGIECIAACVRTVSDMYDVPVALHLDHCSSLDTIVRCIRHGYTSVMIDGSQLPYDENVSGEEGSRVAHCVGVTVEAEPAESPELLRSMNSGPPHGSV